jgi:predicted small secreted protein
MLVRRVVGCVAVVGVLAGCGTVGGMGKDLQGASDSARAALFGGDPDRPPID